MTFIIKANSLQHTGKDKRKSLSDLDNDIEEKFFKNGVDKVIEYKLKMQTMMVEC